MVAAPCAYPAATPHKSDLRVWTSNCTNQRTNSSQTARWCLGGAQGAEYLTGYRQVGDLKCRFPSHFLASISLLQGPDISFALNQVAPCSAAAEAGSQTDDYAADR
jgi:hypothetical protein